MTNLNIDPKLVLKISDELYKEHPEPTYTTGKKDAEIAIHAVFDELGFDRQVAEKGTIERYCSDWKVIE